MKFNKLILLSSLNSVFSSSISLDNFKLSITDSTGEGKLSEKLQYPSPLKTPLTLETSEVIRLSYKLVKNDDKLPIDLPYNTIVIENPEDVSDNSYYQVQSAGKVGQFKLNLPYKTIAKNLKNSRNLDTEFNLYLLVSSKNNREEAIKYKLGSLILPESKKVAEPKAPEFGPQPLIHHSFRPDEKVPAKGLSVVFSGLVLAPWALLLIGWSSFNLNFKKFPTTTYKLIINLGFIGTLFAYTTLNYFYWTKLNLFETLYYFTIITSLALPFGYLTLKNHQ